MLFIFINRREEYKYREKRIQNKIAVMDTDSLEGIK